MVAINDIVMETTNADGQTASVATEISGAGIPIADMRSYALRVYYEKEQSANSPRPNNEYSYAIIRWYRVIRRLTGDLAADGGERRPGLYRPPPSVR